MIASEVL